MLHFWQVGECIWIIKKVGSFISELRKEQGLNQKELAQKLSVTDKAVSKWETGRGIPDVSILQPLANIFGVTVGEILNGERMPQQENNDEQLIKKLKVKQYIRLAIEVIITAVAGYWLYVFYDTFKMYANVLDMYLHRNEIQFLSICTFIYMAIVVIWVLTVIITAIFKKKAVVLKTVMICFTVSFLVGSAVHMAVLEDNRHLQIYDSPVDTVNYIKYNDFFNGAFETQISIKDTNEKITENYSAYFDGVGEKRNFVYTQCVTACEYKIAKDYFDERKSIAADNANYTEMDNKLCEQIGASEGYYISGNNSDNDIELCFIKGTSCYDVNISDTNISDEKLIKEIIRL